MTVGDPPYDQALQSVVALLAELRSRAMLIGGLAVIVHGYVRTTDDIDATISGAEVSVDRILEVAVAHDIHPRIDEAAAFARRAQLLLLIHRPTGVEFDLSLAWLPFEEEALERRMLVRFQGMDLRVCDPEDLIVYKLVAARPHDLEDARQTAMRHWRRIDRERVRRTLAAFDEILEDGRSRVELWRQTERSAFPNA
jgi:predicted nucleotidyltransferase